MGTVGLSFGSPTSGAGFNVSSTVAEIVGNLQNVETPWKNSVDLARKPGHHNLEPGHPVLQSLQRHELAHRPSGNPGAKGGLELRHQRARADCGLVLGNGGHAYGGREQPRPDFERLPRLDRQRLRRALRLDDHRVGQRDHGKHLDWRGPRAARGQHHLYRQRQEHAGRHRHRHQLRQSRTHRQCTCRLLGFPVESRLRHLRRGRKVDRRIVAY